MPEVYVSGQGWYQLPHDPGAGQWGRRPEPPPPSRCLYWFDYCCCCFLIAFGINAIALQLRGFFLADEYSVVTALALLPTCPAPALSMPPVCYDWEKPAAAMVMPSSSGSADSNWRSDGQGGDYKAAKKCFDSLVRDAAWTCDEQEDDNKVAMNCFDSLIGDAARICFIWSYGAIPLNRQSDDPPST